MLLNRVDIALILEIQGNEIRTLLLRCLFPFCCNRLFHSENFSLVKRLGLIISKILFLLIGALMGLKDALQGALTEGKKSDRKPALSS